MTPFEIPVQPSTAQQMVLTMGNVVYTLTFKWNVALNAWVVDIADENNNPIAQGIPIVTGADLLAQFPHLNFGGALIAQTDHDQDAVPTFANFGGTGHVYFVTPG